MPDKMTLKEFYAQIQSFERTLFPAAFNMDKKELIDYVFTRTPLRPVSFADLGGVWRVEAAYTFYALDMYDITNGYLVDTNFTDIVTNRAAACRNLKTITGNFGDFTMINNELPPVDAVFLFDVLLHQVKPDWNEILEFYARRVRYLVIYNQQWIGSKETLRLLDLGKDAYFDNVPHDRNHPTYRSLFDKMYEINPEHNRIWRDIHNCWQWGITDADLIRTVESLGFRLSYYKNCGVFGNLKNFENHAFVFNGKQS